VIPATIVSFPKKRKTTLPPPVTKERRQGKPRKSIIRGSMISDHNQSSSFINTPSLPHSTVIQTLFQVLKRLLCRFFPKEKRKILV
jgi:hypothetical protein